MIMIIIIVFIIIIITYSIIIIAVPYRTYSIQFKRICDDGQRHRPLSVCARYSHIILNVNDFAKANAHIETAMKYFEGVKGICAHAHQNHIIISLQSVHQCKDHRIIYACI